MPESTRIQVGRAVSQLRNDQAPEPVRGDPPATERAAGGHQDQQARSGPGTRQTAHSDALATCPPVRASSGGYLVPAQGLRANSAERGRRVPKARSTPPSGAVDQPLQDRPGRGRSPG